MTQTTVDQLVRDVEPEVRSVCRARIPYVADPAVAVDDVVQEVLVAVTTALRTKHVPPEMVRVFAVGIVRNKTVDAFRRAGRLRHRLVHEADPEPVDPGPGPAELAELAEVRAEQAALVRSLVAQLTPHQAVVLRMRILEERSAEETAAALGSTPGAVRVAQHRALTRLREALGVGPR